MSTASRSHALRLAVAGLPALLAASCLPIACLPASAGEPDATAAVLHWGDALVTGLQAVTAVLLPVAITAATATAARLAGPLRVLLTSTLVERLVRNASAYAVNAVAGAVAGRTLTIPLGSAVIARAVERALDQGPAWLIEAAGGPQGLAEKVFRSLPLEEEAHAGNTLIPGLNAALKARHGSA